ncbi:MAG: DUF4810 domain-containing protein [Steroidobacteraceae bacterium]
MERHWPVARRLLLACAALSMGACATAPRTMYAWGSYEELIYTANVKPGSLTPEAQADQLENDRQVAEAAGKRLPPGWHAQLASLYAESGRVDLAERELLAEKAAFPEATTLMDRLLANLRKSKP